MVNTEAFNHDVIIIGGGATGLVLGLLLLLNKIDCCILEKQPSRGVETKATLLNAVNIQLFKYLNIINELDVSFFKSSKFNFYLDHEKRFELDFGTDGYYLMTQPLLEDIIEKKYLELGGLIKKNRTVNEFQELKDLIYFTAISDKKLENYTTKYIVGCDGEYSIVREYSKINFMKVNAVKNVFLSEGVYNHNIEKDVSMYLSNNDVTSLIPLPNSTVRIGGQIVDIEKEENVLNKKLMLIGDANNIYKSKVMVIRQIQEKVVETFYKGRFILAGEAAHSVFPLGGQGLNYAFQDVLNLSWRLKRIIKNDVVDIRFEMLQEYDKERRLLFMDVIKTADFSNLFTKIRSNSSRQELMNEFLPLSKKLTHLYFNYSNGLLLGKEFLFQPQTLFPNYIKLENDLSITQTNIICHKNLVSTINQKDVNICVIDDTYDLMCDYIIVRPDLVIQELAYN